LGAGAGGESYLLFFYRRVAFWMWASFVFGGFLKILEIFFIGIVVWLSFGCQTAKRPIAYYSNSAYKDDMDGEEKKAPLLLQYKFVRPVDRHEILIIDEKKKAYLIPVKDFKEASEGFVVNLPVNHQYALASFFIILENSKKELQLGRELPLFRLSSDVLTRIRGFDIINDENPDSNSISIAPWDGLTDNLLIVQAAKRFEVLEKSIRTVDVFKK
jgi:hypothetical protein